MKLRLINESYSKECIIELAFVGPKSQGQTRLFGDYQLPHNLQTINIGLLDNIEYYERCVVFDVTHDIVASELLQRLKPMFKKFGSDHGELVLIYDESGGIETITPTWQGSKIQNASKIEQTWGNRDVDGGYLLLYKNGDMIKRIPLSKGFAYAVFQEVDEKDLD